MTVKPHEQLRHGGGGEVRKTNIEDKLVFLVSEYKEFYNVLN